MNSFDKGIVVSVESILEILWRNPILKGITLSGGEPLEQAEGFAELAQKSRLMGLDVMTYTGYTYEEITAGYGDKPGWSRLLDNTDTLVNGPFMQDKRNFPLNPSGSENQKVINAWKKNVALHTV